MGWLFQLIGFQLLFAYICAAVLYGIWRLANPGQKW
jgi:hypothetical protein